MHQSPSPAMATRVAHFPLSISPWIALLYPAQRCLGTADTWEAKILSLIKTCSPRSPFQRTMFHPNLTNSTSTAYSIPSRKKTLSARTAQRNLHNMKKNSVLLLSTKTNSKLLSISPQKALNPLPPHLRTTLILSEKWATMSTRLPCVSHKWRASTKKKKSSHIKDFFFFFWGKKHIQTHKKNKHKISVN